MKASPYSLLPKEEDDNDLIKNVKGELFPFTNLFRIS
jgi:hypothetical protein